MDKEDHDLNFTSFTNDQSWLRSSNFDTLSKEEAGVLADKLIDAYRKEGTITESQQTRLREDIVNVFYDFFLNFETMDQLSKTESYRKIMKKITEKSEKYVDKENIPDLNTLLITCSVHSKSCEKSCSKK